MSDAIATTDLTERATAGGWTLPDGWSVKADLSYDPYTTPDDLGMPVEDHDPEDQDHERMIREWFERDDWAYGVVSVWVQDNTGREWGRSVLGGVEMGTYPNADGSSVFIEPLEDNPGEYSIIREHDMIGEALREAVKELERFGSPVLVEPAGVTLTGL